MHLTSFFVSFPASSRDMFAGAPNQIYRYEALIRFANGATTSWWSPDWAAMTWYEKKRWQRVLTFYDNFEAETAAPVRDAYARKLAREYGNVASVEWIAHFDTPDEEPPSHLGPWDLFEREYTHEIVPLQFINFCDDVLDDCPVWAAAGSCDRDTVAMLAQCLRSCNFCALVEHLEVGSRIAVYWDQEETLYDATVRQVRGSYLQLEYDEYDNEGEQFEWIDGATLHRRGFVELEEEGEEETEEANSKILIGVGSDSSNDAEAQDDEL
jgi:hypothetical protein